MRWRGKNKFRAQRTNGFASKLEAAVYDLLKLREREGEFSNLRCQESVELQGGSRETRINWKIDFAADLPDGQTIYFEAKGVRTSDYVLKLKIFKFRELGIIEVWGGNYRSPSLLERFEPKG